MLTRTHKCGCCFTYDYVTDDVINLLGEKERGAFLGRSWSHPRNRELSPIHA
uniref:Uncharacterized protein n=1 Tax=Nelumbo nucifera TaxID=4432 RepID=A0A822XVD9_NELNU|nr:TPA_asm: hypothetical protein HUJ06_024389 [Nelumbo nucifera]